MAGKNEQGLHTETPEEAIERAGAWSVYFGGDNIAEPRKDAKGRLRLAVASIAGCGLCLSYENGACSALDSIPRITHIYEQEPMRMGFDDRDVTFYNNVGVPLCEQKRQANVLPSQE